MITFNDQNEEHVDLVFFALSQAIRRQILDILYKNPGISVGEVAKEFDVSRIAIMNHLSTLERADLIIAKKNGRQRNLYINIQPIKEIHSRWSDQFSEYWSDRMDIVKQLSEAQTSKKD